MNENPLVTVYIPTYNRLELLKRAVKSVLDQDYSNIELIVVDDGSSDGTVDYLECVSQADQRVRYFVNEVNSGACVSRNKAIWAAKGEFITGLDDDDEFTSDRISSFVKSELIDKYSFLCTRVLVKNKKIYIGSRFSGVINIRKALYKNIIGNQVFTKTRYIKDVGGFDEKFPSWQDYDVWIRLLKRYGDGFKLKQPTYLLNTDECLNRISDLSYKSSGYLFFVEKHISILTKRHIFSLHIENKINSNSILNKRDFFLLIRYLMFSKLVRSYVKRLFL